MGDNIRRRSKKIKNKPNEMKLTSMYIVYKQRMKRLWFAIEAN